MKSKEEKQQATPFSRLNPTQGIVLLVLPGTETKIKDDRTNYETKNIPHVIDEPSIKEMFDNVSACLLPKGFEIFSFGAPIDMYNALAKRLKIPKDHASVIDLTKENIAYMDRIREQRVEIADLKIQVASLEFKLKEVKK